MLDILFVRCFRFGLGSSLPQLAAEDRFELLFPDELGCAVVDVHVLR